MVWLFAPNIVGYIRVALLVVFILCYDTAPLFAITCYSTNMALDAVDGFLARRYNQSTQFGAMLDMVTDRQSSLSLLLVNAIQSTDMQKTFMCLLVLDIVSHWIWVFSA
jgi:CDP-diacylglycerol--inositol 3-phosphatidyltransferase